MKFKKLLYASAGLLMLSTITSCSEEELDKNSIFPTDEVQLDPNSYSYKLDKWLEDNFVTPYNLKFIYRMEDTGSNMTYNLVPASYQASVDLAVLAKYLWFDVYAKISTDPEFLQKYGPRIIHVIGSPAYNPTLGTMVLGTAEGGIKVTLYRVNYIDSEDVDQLNTYYFKTMHHEFGHILHQTKLYPTEFKTISTTYDPSSWQDQNWATILSLGYISPYSSNGISDDWVELIANYVVRSDSWLETAKWIAAHDWQEEESPSKYTKKICYGFYYYPTDEDAKNDNKEYFVYIDAGDSSNDSEDFGLVGRNELVENADGSYTHKSSGRPAYAVAADAALDGVNGLEVLEQKLSLVSTWFKEQWGIDFEELRNEVQERQKNIDINALRAQVENIQ